MNCLSTLCPGAQHSDAVEKFSGFFCVGANTDLDSGYSKVQYLIDLDPFDFAPKMWIMAVVWYGNVLI